MSWPRPATWVITSVTLLVLTADIGMAVISRLLAIWIYMVLATVVALGSSALALLVAQRRPTNIVAPLLSCMALVWAAAEFSDDYNMAQAQRPEVLGALPDTLAALLVVNWVWLYIVVALLFLFFPDGRLPGPRWRWVAAGLVVDAVAIQVVMDLAPGPYDAPFASAGHPFGELSESLADGLKAVTFPLLMMLLVASVVSVWGRYERGDRVRRAQLKWLALAGLGLPLTLALSWGGYLLAGTHDYGEIGFVVLYIGVPVATTIAILRHDLYDVDRALSATLTYGTVSVVLVLLFTVVSFIIGLVFGNQSVPAAAGATALAAVVLAPLRTRVQRGVDRRIYPTRRAALEAVDELRTASNAGQRHPEQLERVLRTALRDPQLRVGFLIPGSNGFVDAQGQPLHAEGMATPVELRGQQIGLLMSLGATSRQLLREIAKASALLVEMVRLRLEVSAALREAESSRARLLRTGYEERRRLERDLHDGAQQRLVALGMSLRLAQRHLDPNTTGAASLNKLLDRSVEELSIAVSELRQIAHGLRPSCLDDGLRPALSLLAESIPLQVDLDVTTAGAVPNDTATTAYYLVSEAVTNAVKHADATRIGLSIEQRNGQLHVRVQDDGCGGATIRPSSGLAGISDRVAAVGGALCLRSPAGQGTTVEATLPCEL
jgi:signal transduction histidine kinase